VGREGASVSENSFCSAAVKVMIKGYRPGGGGFARNFREITLPRRPTGGDLSHPSRMDCCKKPIRKRGGRDRRDTRRSDEALWRRSLIAVCVYDLKGLGESRSLQRRGGGSRGYRRGRLLSSFSAGEESSARRESREKNPASELGLVSARGKRGKSLPLSDCLKREKL